MLELCVWREFKGTLELPDMGEPRRCLSWVHTTFSGSCGVYFAVHNRRKESGGNYRVVTAGQRQANALQKEKTRVWFILVSPGSHEKKKKRLKFQMPSPLPTLDKALSCQTNGL